MFYFVSPFESIASLEPVAVDETFSDSLKERATEVGPKIEV
jgi:hypothetical protein